MVDNFGNISRAFVAFDRRGNGFVTLDELKRVLFHFAFPMSDYLFEQLMDRYVTTCRSSKFESRSVEQTCKATEL